MKWHLWLHPTNTHLNCLAPEGLVGVGIPNVDLLILGTGDKLLHWGMNVQTPQLICMTLWQITTNSRPPELNHLLAPSATGETEFYLYDGS